MEQKYVPIRSNCTRPSYCVLYYLQDEPDRDIFFFLFLFDQTNFSSLENKHKIKLLSRPDLSLRHTCGNYLFYFMIFYYPGRVTKSDSAIISVHLTNWGVLEYPQEHALILHVQNLYQAHLANSRRHDYLGLVQFDLIGTHVCSK